VSLETEPSVNATSAVERWRRVTDGPLLVLALGFLVVFLLPLYYPDLPTAGRRTLWALNVMIWVAFAVDYAVRLYLSPSRRTFVRRHVPDLLALAVPVLRPLRLLRVVGVLGAGGRRAADRRMVGTAAYAVGAVTLMCVVCAGLVLDAERGVKAATLTTAQDALWWAATTVTTVGYGDRYPVTGEGRVIAVALMLAGIALLGVVTATIAAWFVERLQTGDAVTAQASLQDVMVELREIRARLDVLTEQGRDGVSPAGDQVVASEATSESGEVNRV
jgi:voltage-gated potassium channel